MTLARRSWTAEERRYMRRKYPGTATDAIADALGRSARSVYQQAQKMGLCKSKAYMARELERQAARLKRHGAATRYRKGHQPWNAGQKGWTAGGRTAETRFKPGHKPQTWMPVGTVVTDADGYLKRKVRDDAPPGRSRRNWRYLHVIHWERYRGPVPRGHAVVFKNGDKTDIRIGNLECIPRAELMRRNSVHRLPKELALAVQLRGALNRQINKRIGREEQG